MNQLMYGPCESPYLLVGIQNKSNGVLVSERRDLGGKGGTTKTKSVVSRIPTIRQTVTLSCHY